MRWLTLCALLAACGSSGDDAGDDDPLVVDAAATGDAPASGADASPPASRVSDLIRGDQVGALVLEIDLVPGREPRAQVEADLLTQLEVLLDKPAGISAVHDDAITSRGADHAWTDAELFALAGETFDGAGADTAVIHTMFVDGHSEHDSSSGVILGLAWSNRHIVIFADTIEETCGSAALPPVLLEELCSGAELAIWTHEVGHVIGLVDNGLPMVADHRDPDHGAHDVDDDCVMYWAYQGDALVTRLAERLAAGGEAALPFGDACLADIAALRDAR